MTGRLLAIDAGTTSVKVCLFSHGLRLLAKSVREYSLITSPDRAEVRADTYLDAVRQGIREVLPEGGRADALALTTQGETLTVADASGRPLIPFIVWLDQRAGEEAEKLKKCFPDAVFYRETGLPSLNGAVPLAKALWLRAHMPGLLSPGRKLLLLEDFLLHFLTGRFITEKTLQTSTGWFSLRRDGLWDEALRAAGMDKTWLPEIAESGVPAGKLTKDAAAFLGLEAEIPVFTGAMDQVSASYAMHRLMPGSVIETTGTALVAGAVISSPDAPEGGALPPTTVYRHVLPGKYLLLPIGNTGGMSLTWFRDRFCPGEDYAALDRMALASPPGAGGLTFLPFLDGSVDPDPCPEARAVFFGLGLSSRREDCVRAVMEGVAHLLRDLLDITDLRGAPPGPVCSLGGGARSRVWEQIKADICGREFVVPECGEAPSLGAAMLSAEGAGILSRSSPLSPAVTCTYAPDEKNRGLYDRAHKKYTSLYRALRPLYPKEDK